MLFPDTQSWNDLKSLEGLLFYSLRLQELSFDQSDFLEKSVRVTTTQIIKEYEEVVELAEDGLVKGINKDLEVLKSELKSRIKSDPVSRKLIGQKLDRYFSCLESENLKEVKTALELIDLKLQPHVYWDELKNQVKEVVEKPREKDKIINIANLTFEFLVDFGYEKGTIYHFLNTTFFNRDKGFKVEGASHVSLFLDKFDLKKREYEVYFTCSRLFFDISESCENFDVDILEGEQSRYGKYFERKFFRNSSSRKAFIKCKNVMAYDYLNAMIKAEERVSLISDIFVLFHHKRKPWFSDDCLIYNHKKEHVIKSSFSMNSMSKLNEVDLEHAKEIFPIFLRHFSLRSESFKRFNRGVELHAHSLETNEASTQILNLWICLEALLITGKGSHVSAVEDAVTIIMANYYFKERLTNLSDLLVRWDREFYEEISEKLPVEWKSDDEDKILALVGIVKFKNLAEELLSKMDSSPLLRYKFMSLVRDFQNPSRLSGLVKDICKKTEFDIRRIYRRRNKIVHQGAPGSKSSNIVELAHFYLDTVMNSIIYNSLVNDDISSIDNFLLEQKLFRKEHDDLLGVAIKEGISEVNLRKLIFGPDVR